MFISQSVQDGAIGSAAAGDPICQADATSNSLGGTWKAWLSDSTVNAIDRIAEVGPWYRVDKTTRIAYNKAQLISGTLTNSIALYPDGTSSGSKTLWTGTTANGTVSIDTCVDWTVNTADRNPVNKEACSLSLSMS